MPDNSLLNRISPPKDTLRLVNGIFTENLPIINHKNNESIQTIINDLPEMLREPCNIFVDETEKEVFLISAIGIISGILPKYLAHYDGHWVESNLFVYILADYGTGKGGMKYARELVKPIHKRKKEKMKNLEYEFQEKLASYNQQVALFRKGKLAEPPMKPKSPPNLMLFLPVNNSKSGLYQLLHENNGSGIMFETEGDTLFDAIKKDYGNYSDTLRKSFHHEPLEFFRRDGNESINIEKPCLSVVLSSTPDQLKSLIPSTENGLYSRFLYYFLKQDDKFSNVFDNQKESYKQKLSEFAVEFEKLFEEFSNQQKPKYFRLDPEQQRKFVQIFGEKKVNMIKGINPQMEGTANRMGLIAFRIMMILTALRKFRGNDLSQTHYCEDVDFLAAIKIIGRLEDHAIRVFEILGQKPDKKQLAYQMRNNGYSVRDIEKTTGINRGTLSRYFKELNKK